MKKHITLKTQVGSENLVVRLGKSSNINQRTEKQATRSFAHDLSNFVSAKVVFGGCGTNSLGNLSHATEHKGDVPFTAPNVGLHTACLGRELSVTVIIHEVSK